jgi:aquaporin Z
VNGYAELSPQGYGMMTALVTEVVMTFFFLFIILGVTDKRGTAVAGGLAIGLALTLIHLISIPVTNTSVNPARSTGPALALFLSGEGKALAQLWLFWVAPIAGAVLAAVVYKLFEVADEPAGDREDGWPGGAWLTRPTTNGLGIFVPLH